MCQVQIKENGRKIQVTSPYNPTFVKRAKTLGGRWNSENKTWDFHQDDREDVEVVLGEMYGFGDNHTVNVILQIQLDANGVSQIERFGRVLAYRPDRDSPVRFHETCILQAGELPDYGGSRQYPSITDRRWSDRNTVLVFKVKDVPRSLIDESSDEVVEIIEQQSEKDALIEKKQDLLHQIDEIEKKLALMK